MAFSLACDSGKTTLRIEGTDTDVSFNDVYTAGATSVAVDGGGTENPSFFITEYLADVHYKILKNIEFGDGTNTLTFLSVNESIYFDDDVSFQVQAQATLNIGDVVDSYSIDGAYWSIMFQAYYGYTPFFTEATAAINIYNSQLYHRGNVSSTYRMYFNSGTLNIKNSIIGSNDIDSFGVFELGSSLVWSMEDVYISNSKGLYINSGPVLMTGIWFHNSKGIIDYNSGTIRVYNIRSTGSGLWGTVSNTGVILELVNPYEHLTTDDIQVGGGTDPTIREVYTINIEILDRHANPIENAQIKHYIAESSDGGTTWDAYTYLDTYTTDVNGLTGEQDFDWVQWVTSSETQTDYKHRLEIVASGQDKKILNDIRPDNGSMFTQFQPPSGVFFHGSRQRVAF